MIQKPITARHVYWSITALLCVVQLVFTLHSRSQLRYEELAESVRNVLWLEHRTIYDGVSSNVGWYGTLLIVYKIFGFPLHAVKFVRLVWRQRGASPFFSTGDHPSQSLDAYVQQALSADLRLECRHWVGECRYAEIYAAVAGRCLWNRLPCHKLLGYDEKTGQFIPLSIALWENYYWKH